jgi:hypothetical protein
MIRKNLSVIIALASLIGAIKLPALANNTKPPVLLGLYNEYYLGEQNVIDIELRQLNNWSGKRHSIAGFLWI